MTPAIELVSMLLAGWSGPAGSWYCVDGERLGTADDPEFANSGSHLAIANRGGVQQQAGVNATETRVRRFHGWKYTTGLAFIPSTRAATDAAMALSWMRSSVHVDLLLTFAQEDVGRWPRVRMVLSVRHTIAEPLLDHAMAGLMRPMKRNRMSASQLAMGLGMRKGDYLNQRRRADDLLLFHLDKAADRFLSALGNRKYPGNDTNIKGVEKIAA